MAQLSIEFVGFTGRRWPSNQRLIQGGAGEMSKLRQINDDRLVQRFFEHDYRDRGVIKWQGFYLSDRTADLKEAS